MAIHTQTLNLVHDPPILLSLRCWRSIVLLGLCIVDLLRLLPDAVEVIVKGLAIRLRVVCLIRHIDLML